MMLDLISFPRAFWTIGPCGDGVMRSESVILFVRTTIESYSFLCHATIKQQTVLLFRRIPTVLGRVSYGSANNWKTCRRYRRPTPLNSAPCM